LYSNEDDQTCIPAKADVDHLQLHEEKPQSSSKMPTTVPAREKKLILFFVVVFIHLFGEGGLKAELEEAEKSTAEQ